jgi:hypothetical protein
MTRVFTLISAFLIAVLFSLQVWAGEARLYMLTTPIEQTTELTRGIKAAALAFDVLVVTTKATIAYHVAGRYPAGMVVLNGMLTEVGTFTAETRGLMAAQSLHNRKKELQEIANGDGVEQIRVFTVGDFNNRGITSATLHSTSIVFAETNGEMPADHRGSEWVPVENPDHAKIRLTLRINGQEKGEPIDIPLEDLFNGTPAVDRPSERRKSRTQIARAGDRRRARNRRRRVSHRQRRRGQQVRRQDLGYDAHAPGGELGEGNIFGCARSGQKARDSQCFGF